MNIGVSLILLTIGAILTFAVNVTTSGFNVHTVGIILMIVGAAWLLLTLFIWGTRRNDSIRRPPTGGIVEERRLYEDDSPLP